MARALLSGYYGMRNTGDDALLAVTAWGTQHFLGVERCLVTAAVLPGFAARMASEPIYNRRITLPGQGLARRLMAAHSAMHVVFGGGSVFHSSSSIRDSLRLVRASRGRIHVAIGVSLGPFRDGAAERACAELLKRLAFVGVRDRDSAEAARILAPDARVEQTFDLAPLLTLSEGLDLDRPGTSTERRGVGIALCRYESFVGASVEREELRIDRIIEAVRRCRLPDDEELVLIDFNGHPIFGDGSVSARLAHALSATHRVRHVAYSDRPVEVLGLVGRLRGLLAMRLHAAVFGFLTHTPTVMVSYHPKCDGWARRIGAVPESVMSGADVDPDALAALLERVVAGDELCPQLSVSEAVTASERNWSFSARYGLRQAEGGRMRFPSRSIAASAPSAPEPEVSVIVPVFNGAAHIERALTSVAEQSLPSFEVVVVDDASTDDTARVVAGFAAADSRIRLLSLDRNSGPAAARNHGMAAARGRWVTVLDADDFFDRERLRVLRSVAARLGDRAVLFDAIKDMAPNRSGAMVSVGRYAKPRRGTTSTRPVPVRARDTIRRGLGVQPFFARALLSELRAWYPEDCRFGEDLVFLLRLLSLPDVRLFKVPEPLYVCCLVPYSLSTAPARLRDLENALRLVLSEGMPESLRAEVRRKLARIPGEERYLAFKRMVRQGQLRTASAHALRFPAVLWQLVMKSPAIVSSRLRLARIGAVGRE